MRRGAVRVDADELTYPVHIMMRYDLEKRILDGELRVADLQDAWNSEIEQRLGVAPATPAQGCLQDMHWAIGSFGYFPSYALGAFIAAQLYESLRSERPGLDEEIAEGQFGGLFEWLRANVHGLRRERECAGPHQAARPASRYRRRRGCAMPKASISKPSRRPPRSRATPSCPCKLDRVSIRPSRPCRWR